MQERRGLDQASIGEVMVVGTRSQDGADAIHTHDVGIAAGIAQIDVVSVRITAGRIDLIRLITRVRRKRRDARSEGGRIEWPRRRGNRRVVELPAKCHHRAGQRLKQPERDHGQAQIAMDSLQRRIHAPVLANGFRDRFCERVQ